MCRALELGADEYLTQSRCKTTTCERRSARCSKSARAAGYRGLGRRAVPGCPKPSRKCSLDVRMKIKEISLAGMKLVTSHVVRKGTALSSTEPRSKMFFRLASKIRRFRSSRARGSCSTSSGCFSSRLRSDSADEELMHAVRGFGLRARHDSNAFDRASSASSTRVLSEPRGRTSCRPGIL